MADPGNVARAAITPSEERLWVAAIAANPADMTVRLIFSDWLEERGRDKAGAFWRWAADVGLMPWSGSAYQGPHWWRQNVSQCNPREGDLPKTVFDALADGKWCETDWRDYETDPLACWSDLAAAADAFDANREDAHV